MNADGVFVGPLDDPDATTAKLILFLYRIAPSATLRNREHRVPSIDPLHPVIVYDNALPLDLHYLVTVGTTAGGEEPLLRMLGSAMLMLQLDPELNGYDVRHEAVHVSLEPLTTEESARIWSLFPTANYRTSVAYIATPVWIDPPLPREAARPVQEDTLTDGARSAATVA